MEFISMMIAFAPFFSQGPWPQALTLVTGLDDTIEGRWGKRIASRGVYPDPVGSSPEHLVKTSGFWWLRN
jgi:hypothetical protein